MYRCAGAKSVIALAQIDVRCKLPHRLNAWPNRRTPVGNTARRQSFDVRDTKFSTRLLINSKIVFSQVDALGGAHTEQSDSTGSNRYSPDLSDCPIRPLPDPARNCHNFAKNDTLTTGTHLICQIARSGRRPIRPGIAITLPKMIPMTPGFEGNI